MRFGFAVAAPEPAVAKLIFAVLPAPGRKTKVRHARGWDDAVSEVVVPEAAAVRWKLSVISSEEYASPPSRVMPEAAEDVELDETATTTSRSPARWVGNVGVTVCDPPVQDMLPVFDPMRVR